MFDQRPKSLNALVGITLTIVSLATGCRRGPDLSEAEPPTKPTGGAATNRPPVAAQTVPAATPVPAQQLPPFMSLQDYSFETLQRKFPLPPNMPSKEQIQKHLKSLETWITDSQGSPVISDRTRVTEANKAAVKDLQFLLNAYNLLVPELHRGQKSWEPLPIDGDYNRLDVRGRKPTDAMSRRTQILLGVTGNGKFGRESFFRLQEELEAAIGAAPRLHTVLKGSVMRENASLATSPNRDPFTRYPEIQKYCSESALRIIAPANVSTNVQRDVALVREIQHCLIKLGYKFDFSELAQTGKRSNATDEALKRFQKDFLGISGPVAFDQRLIFSLVVCATGNEYIFGRILSHEWKQNPFSRDPLKTYCGMTQETFTGWCKQKGIKPPPLFQITEAQLRACFRDVFILPSGTQHLLAKAWGANRDNGLQIAGLVADESFNRNPYKALETVAKVLELPRAEPTRATMERLFENPTKSVLRLSYFRALGIGIRGGDYEVGLSNRLEEGSNHVVTIAPQTVQQWIDTGLQHGRTLREQSERAQVQALPKAAEKKSAAKDSSIKPAESKPSTGKTSKKSHR